MKELENLKVALTQAAKTFTGNAPANDRKAISSSLRAFIHFMQRNDFPVEAIIPFVNLEGEIGNVDEGRTSPLFTQELPERPSKQPPKSVNDLAREATYFACIDFLVAETDMTQEQAARFVETHAKKHGKGLKEYKKHSKVVGKRHPYLERRIDFFDNKKQNEKERVEIYECVKVCLARQREEGARAEPLVEAMITHL